MSLLKCYKLWTKPTSYEINHKLQTFKKNEKTCVPNDFNERKKYNVIKHCEWLVEICLENDV